VSFHSVRNTKWLLMTFTPAYLGPKNWSKLAKMDQNGPKLKINEILILQCTLIRGAIVIQAGLNC
jgi:hypothetical protein